MDLLSDAGVAFGRLGGPFVAGLAVLVGLGLPLIFGLWPGRGLADWFAAAPGAGLLVLTMAWWGGTWVGGGMLGAGLVAMGLCSGAVAARKWWPAVGAAAAELGTLGGARDVVWLAVVWGATAVVRLATVRDVYLPPWVDGVHHTYLTQLLLASGGVPAEYGALLGFGPFSYHFGFHALAATASVLSGAAAPDAVLAAGQMLSACAAPTAYLVARLYGGTARAALAAAVVAGLVSVMPAYYVSWSRFTELAGLAALPCWLLLVRRVGVSWPLAVAAGLATAAMVMVHPRVLVMGGALVVAEMVVLRGWWRARATGAGMARALVAAVVGTVVAGPWLGRVLGSLVPRLAVAPAESEAVNRLELTLISTGWDPWIYGAAAMVGVAGLMAGSVGAQVAAGLLVLVLVAANPGTLGLPGSYLLSNGAVVIALWLPAAALTGCGLEWLMARVPMRWQPGLPVAVLTAGLLLSGGARDTLNAGTVLATAADRRGLEAAAAVLPAGARVAVSVREWQLRTFMGTDGGYWVGLLTPGRAIVPPLLYGLGPPDGARAISDDLAGWEAAWGDPSALLARMRAQKVDWLFAGERGTFDAPPELELVLREEGAALYRLRP